MTLGPLGVEEPPENHGPADGDNFEEFVTAARAIKERLVDANRDWYRDHQFWPFVLFRSAGIVTILFSVALPAVASLDDATIRAVSWLPSKAMTISVMSVTIAALTGLGAFFRWERSWRGRNSSKFAIDAMISKWELEMENARRVVEPAKRVQHVYLATDDLLTNFRSVGSEENEQFFGGLQFPQANAPRQ